MQLQVQDICKLAMGKVNAVRINEPPYPYEATLCIMLANIMLDEWAGEEFMLRTQVQRFFTLTAGTPNYNVGPNQTFNVPKPIEIVNAFIQDNYGVRTGLDIVRKDVYDGYLDSQFSQARPLSLYYDPGTAQQFPVNYGTIWLYYTPDASLIYTLYYDADEYMMEFVNPTDTVTFEPLYYSAIYHNLARQLFRHFHGVKVPLPPDIEEDARLSKERVMSRNAKRRTAAIDVPGKAVGPYNVYTGMYTGY